jgi:hypothetical protein
MRTALLLAALSFALPAFADDDLNPEKAAKIDRDTDKALKAVDKKYGNRKPSELSSDERKQVIQERAAAEREVLEKHNVSPKAYTSYTARQSRDERAATKQAGAALEAKEQAAEAEKAKEAAGGPKEITIQRGGAGRDPIVMEEKEGAAPMVEKGLPQDAQDDQAAAGVNGQTDSSTEEAPAAAPAPKPKGKGKGKSR